LAGCNISEIDVKIEIWLVDPFRFAKQALLVGFYARGYRAHPVKHRFSKHRQRKFQKVDAIDVGDGERVTAIYDGTTAQLKLNIAVR